MKTLVLKLKQKSIIFFEAMPAGFIECWTTLGRYITGLRQLFTGKAKLSESLGSVLSIGGIYPPFWDWQNFLDINSDLQYHSCIHEYITNTGFRWRSCIIYIG